MYHVSMMVLLAAFWAVIVTLEGKSATVLFHSIHNILPYFVLPGPPIELRKPREI